ncbi:MAG: thiol:disulfide interchange protein, partial [Prevotellaceae bacterium]|nr:thiol:disulfide interchange protein [Prevotellaceae bacterium]
MNKKIIFISVLMLIVAFSGTSQIFEPVRWKFEKKLTGDKTADLIFSATIDDGWHLYGLHIPDDGPRPTSFTFETLQNVRKVGEMQSSSKLIENYDANFGMTLNWYNHNAVFVQKITFDDPEKVLIEGYVEFMTCNDESCLPPAQEEFVFKFSDTAKKEPADSQVATTSTDEQVATGADTENLQLTTGTDAAPDYWTPVVDELRNYGNTAEESSSFWWIFLLGFGGGLIALITPCVWPVIPMTVSFFLKRSENRKKGRKDAILYGLAIIIIYVALGLLITLIFGASALNDLSTNAVFNLFLFALLVVFAISFFGAFEITLPSSWTTKMDAKAESTAGFLSILFMAFTLVLVSFSCTGPIIGLLLVEVSVSGSILGPLMGMFGFAVALAIPFSLFAFFPTWLKSLPKSGGWLNTVKIVLAFLELAFALKFLSVADLAYGWGILDREVFIALWIVIFALLGMYLLGKIRFPHDSETKHTSVTGVFLAMISLAFAVYMVPGLWGAPLKAVSAFSPPLYTQDFNLNTTVVHFEFDDYDEGMAYAAKKGLPVVLDFTGFGCVN